MALVGKDGKVILIKARGENLRELLAELYPDAVIPNETPEEKNRIDDLAFASEHSSTTADTGFPISAVLFRHRLVFHDKSEEFFRALSIEPR